MCQIEDAVAATFEHLDLVIETFYETTGVSLQKVVRDLIHIGIQSTQKAIKAGQLAFSDTSFPGINLVRRFLFGQLLLARMRASGKIAVSSSRNV